ncbi:MAG: SAM-dependent methyltransferase [Dehalococcoidaceae bacterium]|nr:SAM-dependent methyltransferase [Dehalococcoidaceae bacterium]
MSSQIEINERLVKYLQSVGYRDDKIINDLANETLKLGSVSPMQIAKEQGQFLEIITKISGAKLCLEIGRFTGMSTLFIARGLPKTGKIITIDNSDEFLPLAKKYWDLDNMSSKIESIIGNGVEVMESMIDRQHSFDLIFIDADKNNYPNYYELSLCLIPSNGIIIIDNMLWHGDVADKNKDDSQTNTIRDLNLKIQKDTRVEFSLLPLSDGLSFIRKI